MPGLHIWGVGQLDQFAMMTPTYKVSPVFSRNTSALLEIPLSFTKDYFKDHSMCLKDRVSANDLMESSTAYLNRLPAELRLIIYNYLFDEEGIY
jgi:hypothetical protein